jgi:hypothetical protein
VVGGAYVDLALRNGSTEFAYPNQQLVTEWVVPEGPWSSLTVNKSDYRMLDGAGVISSLDQAWVLNNAVS